VLALSAGELSGPLITGWGLPYVGVRQWCGLLAGVGVVVLLLYLVTFVCLKAKKIEANALLPTHSGT